MSLKPINTDNSKYNFTTDQKNAIDNIIDFITKDFNPKQFVIGLTGAGGTGKTFITNFIINNCKYSSSVIKCASPTHKACRVFSSAINNKKVETIQSILGLRLNLKLEDFNPNNPQFDPMGEIKLANTKVLIIDEASMIPAKLVTFICNICKKYKIKIIFIGDDYQLAPVNESKSIAFSRCFKVNPLTQIVRQDKQNPIGDLLVLLRNDIKNRKFSFLEYVSKNVGINNYNEFGEGYSILGQKDFKDTINISFKDENYFKDIDMYRIVAYTNNKVAYWNNYVRNIIIPDANKNIITKNDLIMSYETIVDDFLDTILNNSEEYIIKDIVNFVDNTYDFKGFLIKFQLVHGGDITKPLFIIDHKDKYTILKYNKVLKDLISAAENATGGNRVKRWKEYYDFKKKYLLAANVINANGKIIYSRDIDYGFAITSHKSQGSTYANVYVDINDMVFDKNNIIYSNMDNMLRRLYVGCSRAKSKLILCYGN